MFFESFKVTGFAVFQAFIVGLLGYFLVKKGVLKDEAMNFLTHLVIEITLPAMIFSKLLSGFSFALYPDWWVFPLISIAITAAGLLIGFLFLNLIKGGQRRLQFLSLVSFQNSGYLPLALVASLLPALRADTMFIYIFLFLMGFNLVIWSFGVYLLTFHSAKKFELGSLFSPPVIATLFSLGFIYLGLPRYAPEVITKPLSMLGDCTLPLAVLVVGANLAQIRLGKADKKALFFILLAKLVILPALGILFLLTFRLPELISLLILLQLAVPPATSLSMIIRHYKKEDLLISQGIFFGHLLSLLTLPLFLSLYFTFVMVR